jgi:phosphoribosyl 1,2-cyclic phosphodiesterase
VTTVRLWGTRGSLATPGPETARYGGNTSCVEVSGPRGEVLVLDAGTGIRQLGPKLAGARRVDILLTHLHMDHIQGLGFFTPLTTPGAEVHIWGPASTTMSLRARLMRYLSPPFFPIHLSELPCRLELHEVAESRQTIGPFTVTSDLICHPGPTVGYRIEVTGASLAYLCDHEPALGVPQFPLAAQWTSGLALAEGVDLLIHDAQYDAADYSTHIGWGHSSFQQAIQFSALARVRKLVLFHYSPNYGDEELEHMAMHALQDTQPAFPVVLGREGAAFILNTRR